MDKNRPRTVTVCFPQLLFSESARVACEARGRLAEDLAARDAALAEAAAALEVMCCYRATISARVTQ